MNKIVSKDIIDNLRLLIKNPQCELDFKNTFELLCAVMLSAQTTDKRVNLVTPKLFSKYPTPEALQAADIEDVKEIIKSIGLANNKAKNIIQLAYELNNKFNGIVPNALEELVTLPGVGRKTASVVLAVGFGIPAMPVDTHLHRVSIRLGYVKKTGTVLEAEEALKKYIPKEDWIEAHHLMLLFGRYHCTAINPKCSGCPLFSYCKYKSKNIASK